MLDQAPTLVTDSEERPGEIVTPEGAARWSVPAREETFEGTSFSLWKAEPKIRPSIPTFSKTFLIGMPIATAALLGIGRLIVEQIKMGNFLPAQIFGIAILILMFGAELAILIGHRWKLRKHGTSLTEDRTEIPPSGIPNTAIAARASIGVHGRSLGWLWFENDQLRFRGDLFDLRLQRKDIGASSSTLSQLRRSNGMSLRAPKGISQRLLLVPGTIAGGRFTADPRLWRTVESEVTSWGNAYPSSRPSLLPPLRALPLEPLPLGWKAYVGPPLFSGLIFTIVWFMLPVTPIPGEERSPSGTIMTALVFGLLCPLPVWMRHYQKGSFNRLIEKVLGRSNDRVS